MEAIPQSLKDIRQWLVWRFINKPGAKKPSKVPHYATTGSLRTGTQGSDDDRANLVDFETAMEVMALREYDGLGFAFLPGDGLIGIDLDGCFNTDDSDRKTRAGHIINACASYTELSPSGNGAHIIVRGSTETFKSNDIGVEVFCGSQFFTMTGRHMQGTPVDVQQIDPAVLDKLRRTVKGSKPPPQPLPAPVLTNSAKVESALAMISPDCGYEDWIRIGMAIHAELGPGAIGVWDHWSSRGADYKGGKDIESHWKSFKPGAVTGATLFKLAMDNGWRPPAQPKQQHRPEQVDPETGEITEYNNDNIQPPMDIFAEFPAPSLGKGMLPAAVEAYAAECSDMVGVDPSMIAIPALVACAAALHDGVRIQPKRHEKGWTESARLWCAVVGAPSVRKTPAIKRATKRLRHIDRELSDDNARLAADYAQQFEQYQSAKKEAKKSGVSIPAPEKPAMARMIVEDITVEALSEVLKDNARGVLCIQDELSGWFGSMDAYSGSKAGNKDRAAWLQAYNGGYRQVDRVMRGAVSIPNFSVSMIGGIQPDAIRRIAKDMTDDGLMQRFMIVVGRNAVEHDRPENDQANREFGDLVEAIHRVQPSENVVTLSEEAHKVRERLLTYAQELADYPALPGGLRSHVGKWAGLFARLLLTFHAIECVANRVHPCQVEVDGATAAQVERLMRFFLLPHALAYYTDILGASSDLEHARWIAGHILSKKLAAITNRDLMQSYKQWRGMDDYRRQRVVHYLEDTGWLVPITDGTPKRAASAWTVNPTAHSHFAEKATDEAQRREKIRCELLSLRRQNA